jgi:hypothetical protein
MSIKQIVDGWRGLFSDAFDNIPPERKELAETRAKICIACDAYFVGMCNPAKKVTNVKTGKLVNGCGCVIAPKVLCTSCSCPADKW